MAKKKFYVVWNGYAPGIYKSWAETQEQIKGYPNAKYKSFPSIELAKEAFVSGYSPPAQKKSIKSYIDISLHPEIIKKSISVDAACSGNPGKMEYQGVETVSGKQLFHVGPLNGGTNNVGEFLALIHVLAYCDKNGLTDIPIYSDSRTAMAWWRNKKVKTTLKRTTYNTQVFQLLERAISWMDKNQPQNPILKWKTEEWGEIPADFGRK